MAKAEVNGRPEAGGLLSEELGEDGPGEGEGQGPEVPWLLGGHRGAGWLTAGSAGEGDEVRREDVTPSGPTFKALVRGSGPFVGTVAQRAWVPVLAPLLFPVSC